MKFRRITAGEFVMGLPDDQFHLPYPPDAVPHPVRITKDFLLGTYEVTQEQYQLVMLSNPSWHAVTGEGAERIGTVNTSNWPVDNVSWDDATEFCRRLSDLPTEKVVSRSYRLPTEAEWEYACRAGRTGKIKRPSWQEAMNTGEIGSNKPPQDMCLVPGPVGSYAPNPFGVHDLCGSVFQWTADYRRKDTYANSPVDYPTGPPTGYLRVIRSWYWVATGPACRVYVANEPWVGSRFIGFRVVCMQN